MNQNATAFKSNRKFARRLWPGISPNAVQLLRQLTTAYELSIASGDLLLLEGRWYVTHAGLLGLARRHRCAGIQVKPVQPFCDSLAQRWAFEATVYKSRTCRGFSGYGDADPSNGQLLQGFWGNRMPLWGRNWADSIRPIVSSTSRPNSWRCSSVMVVRRY